jgi:hypothetical protein
MPAGAWRGVDPDPPGIVEHEHLYHRRERAMLTVGGLPEEVLDLRGSTKG